MFKFYMKRTIKKLLAFPLWLVFILLDLIAKPLSLVARIFSLPVALLSAVGIYMSYNAGMNGMMMQYGLTAVIAVVLFFAAPHIASWIYYTKHDLKETALFPIVVRPKIRYKVDLNY